MRKYNKIIMLVFLGFFQSVVAQKKIKDSIIEQKHVLL